MSGTSPLYSPRAGSASSGSSRTTLVVIGIVLLGIALVLVVSSLSSFGQSSQPDPNDPNWFARESARGTATFVTCGISMALGMAGIMLLYLGLLRRVTTYVAGETAPAVQTTTGAIGQGLAQGTQQGGGIRLDVQPGAAPATAIRVRCRNCGYLETEDARLCSSCGRPL